MYAYLTDEKETINEIRLTQNDTHIEEEFDPPAGSRTGNENCEKAGCS